MGRASRENPVAQAFASAPPGLIIDGFGRPLVPGTTVITLSPNMAMQVADVRPNLDARVQASHWLTLSVTVPVNARQPLTQLVGVMWPDTPEARAAAAQVGQPQGEEAPAEDASQDDSHGGDIDPASGPSRIILP